MIIFFIIIVGCIVIGVSAHDAIAHNEKKIADYTKAMLKTNAILERKVLDQHMKHGCSFDEAYELTKCDMIKNGYQPCIPKEAYDTRLINLTMYTTSTSHTKKNPEEYDSDIIKARRQSGVGYEQLYEDFPKTILAYEMEIKSNALKAQAVPVGRMITHPKYGMCEVVSFVYSDKGIRGNYVLKVISTSAIVRDIPIGDKQIRVV